MDLARDTAGTGMPETAEHASAAAGLSRPEAVPVAVRLKLASGLKPDGARTPAGAGAEAEQALVGGLARTLARVAPDRIRARLR